MDITGFYKGSDNAFYYVRQIGSKLYWLAELQRDDFNFVHIFQGDIFSVIEGGVKVTKVTGSWWDLPKGNTTNSGDLAMRTVQDATGVSVIRTDGVTLKSSPAPSKHRASDMLVRWPGLGNTMTGIWTGNNDGLYYIREVGNTIVWMAEDQFTIGRPGWCHLFFGTKNGDTITGTWVEIPKGNANLNSGIITLTLDTKEENRTLRRTDTDPNFGEKVWRQGPPREHALNSSIAPDLPRWEPIGYFHNTTPIVINDNHLLGVSLNCLVESRRSAQNKWSIFQFLYSPVLGIPTYHNGAAYFRGSENRFLAFDMNTKQLSEVAGNAAGDPTAFFMYPLDSKIITRVFVRGQGGRFMHTFRLSDNIGKPLWLPTLSPANSGIFPEGARFAKIEDGAKKGYLFGRGMDNGVYFLRWNAAQKTFGEWQSLNGGRISNEPTSLLHQGTAYVFARGLDGCVYMAKEKGDGWEGWFKLGDLKIAADARICATGYASVSFVPEQITLFVKGEDNRLWRLMGDGGTTWGEWERIHGYGEITSEPVAISHYLATEVIAKGVNNTLWRIFIDSKGINWTYQGFVGGQIIFDKSKNMFGQTPANILQDVMDHFRIYGYEYLLPVISEAHTATHLVYNFYFRGFGIVGLNLPLSLNIPGSSFQVQYAGGATVSLHPIKLRNFPLWIKKTLKIEMEIQEVFIPG